MKAPILDQIGFEFDEPAAPVLNGKTKPELRLIRRNGLVVPWDTNKIEVAVRKAFLTEQDGE